MRIFAGNVREGLGKLSKNTQNRDSEAVHLKLDELTRSIDAARNALVGSEDLPEKRLDEIQEEFDQIAHEARNGSSHDRIHHSQNDV